MTSHPTAYSNCNLCPRACGVDRNGSALGYCRSTSKARLASAVLHRGEEPSLSTGRGSGAMFFSGCTLRCDSCQNCGISAEGIGRDVDLSTLSEIMLRLDASGASNINIVTGTHFAPAIVEAVDVARAAGLRLPVVWNTSGYESIKTLEHLSTIVDVWLPDIKTFDPAIAKAMLNAPDYPARVKDAALWMSSRSTLRYDGDTLVSGTICRHLVLPGLFDDTESVLRWYADHLRQSTLLSVMAQYIPTANGGETISRSLERSEYDAMIALLWRFDIDSGFVQELEDERFWIPDFARTNPFPGQYSDPVWHWRFGFVDSDDRDGVDGGVYC